MAALHSERISRKLFFSMLIIILSILLISVPLIWNSYQTYTKTNHALVELRILQALTDTANKISRERAPTNSAMASTTTDQLARHKNELMLYRRQVDQQIQATLLLLEQEGYRDLSAQFKARVVRDLESARTTVDQFIATSAPDKNAAYMDQAILSMFNVWDSCFLILKQFIHQTRNEDTHLAHYFTFILLLTDMRDQAGRVASHIIPAVTFKQPIPLENQARSLHAQQHTLYLWDMLNTLQSRKDETREYRRLHQQVREQFLGQGLDIINQMISQGQGQANYALTGTQLIENMIGKFNAVVDLQGYMIEHSVDIANRHRQDARLIFLLTFFVSLVSLITAIFTMAYAKSKVFDPLLQLRKFIFALSDPQRNSYTLPQDLPKKEFFSLFDAIAKLQSTLQQREEKESKLRQIANSDALTGVANRLVLDEYIQALEKQPDKLTKTCLMIIDIDDFKFVNDTYGHMFGDRVIRYVAKQLKKNVRATDLIIRYGGDEFLILIDCMSMPDALQFGEKIRHLIANTEIDVPNNMEALKISVSIGVAIGAESWVDLMEQADQSLLKQNLSARTGCLIRDSDKG